jgi:hypothetical protein
MMKATLGAARQKFGDLTAALLEGAYCEHCCESIDGIVSWISCGLAGLLDLLLSCDLTDETVLLARSLCLARLLLPSLYIEIVVSWDIIIDT